MAGKGKSSGAGKRLKKKVEELSILYEVSQVITSTLDLDKVLNLIVERAVYLMRAQVGSLRLLDKEGELILGASYGHSHSDEYWRKKGKLKLKNGLSGLAARKKQPIIVKNVQKDKRYKYPNLARKEGLVSLLSVPLMEKGKPIGILSVYTKKVHSFRKREVELLSHFASQAAIAIRNAQLYKRLHQVYLNSIRALAAAIDARDKSTYGHSEQVAKYARAVAKEMRLSGERIEMLEHACRLHDIGKIGIHDYILTKPGKLNNKEWSEIRTHPTLGREILEPLEFLKEIVPLVRQHHERYDGKGYPDGLKGEEICLEARIISVADAYGAMTSERPYRLTYSSAKAKRELRNCAGRQFDPKVVKAFLSALEKEGKKLA